MKFQVKDKQIIRNEIISRGAHYPLFYMMERTDGFVFYQSENVEIVTLVNKLYDGKDNIYEYEIWDYDCITRKGDSSSFIKTIGYETIQGELCYAEEYNEV